jgi:Ca2+-transporting ATPase
LPSLALALEPRARDVMRRPPRDPRANVFGEGLGIHIVWVGVLMGVVAVGMGWWAWRAGDSNWRTMVFTTVTLSQLFHTLVIRSFRQSVFRQGLFSNRTLAWTILVTLGLQMAVVYLKPLQVIFKTSALSLRDLVISLALSFTIFWAVELEKLIWRRIDSARARAQRRPK